MKDLPAPDSPKSPNILPPKIPPPTNFAESAASKR